MFTNKYMKRVFISLHRSASHSSVYLLNVCIEPILHTENEGEKKRAHTKNSNDSHSDDEFQSATYIYIKHETR